MEKSLINQIEKKVKERIQKEFVFATRSEFFTNLKVATQSLVGPINIMGPTGVGKTTVCHSLAKELGTQYRVMETVTADDKDTSFYKQLANFYASPESAAFGIQIEALHLRFLRIIQAINYDILDEGFLSDLVYARVLATHDYLTATDYETYYSAFEILRNVVPQSRLYIFLDADVSHLRERILSRGRGIDETASNEYLNNVREGFHDFFKELTDVQKIYVDTNDTETKDIITHIIDQMDV